MMQKIPDTTQSVPSQGGAVGLTWKGIEDQDIQCWQLVRCDYPITARNGSGLLSGGLDLMTQRWELHPSYRAVVDDTGGNDSKHYLVLGLCSRGQVHFPDGFELDPIGEGVRLSKEKSPMQGWVKGVKAKKDRYSGMF